MNMGAYELLEPIGHGGMGVVYRGRHVETGQIVAVKVMTAESMRQPVLLKRFAQECSVAGRLRHPNIVGGLDFGFEGNRPYLVMEFVEGQSLGQRVRKLGPLTESETVRIGVQIADALHVAHGKKLIHRDVKPDNILLTKDNQAKLADLGLIKDLDTGMVLTRPRAALGTIVFIPPEQFENAQEADARCDVYGLGATLYYGLTGVAPFQGHGNLTVLQKKLQNEFVPPSRYVRSLSEAVDKAICRAIDASPDQRPSTCQEFGQLLAAARPTEPVEEPTPEDTKEEMVEPVWEERRKAFRYPSSRSASYQMIPGEKNKWQAEVNDISQTGVCLQLYRRCERGSILSLELADQDTDLSLTLLARVNWVRKSPDGTWSVGCSFSRSLTQEEMQALLGNVPVTIVVQEPV